MKNLPLKTLARFSTAALVGMSMLAQSANASVITTSRAHASVIDRSHMTPYFTTLPARGVNYANLGAQAQAGNTIPFFTDSVQSPLDGHTYQYSIVGTNPKNSKIRTILRYIPIMLRIHFPDGTVLDPTKPACNDTKSVRLRFFAGPLFRNTVLTSNGVNVGNTQIVDGFMRAEFWSLVQGSTYHVTLKPAAPVRVVDYNAPSGSTTQAGVCAGSGHNLGEITINAYDNELTSLSEQFATANQLPIIMAYNLVLTSGGCCIIGYHSAFNRPDGGGTQVYANGAYVDAGIFSVPIEDIHAWTHEIGEAFNDPFVNNATPAWGHIGQVGGCQGNLEVGDPLTGVPFLVTYKGFTYHPQEMAYFDWFYRTPSQGTGGKFSFEGRFTSSQGACH